MVETFKEKPTADVAAEYIKRGALWNGGVFAYKLKYVLEKAHELIDFTDYQDLFDKYDTLTKFRLIMLWQKRRQDSGAAFCGTMEGSWYMEYTDGGNGGICCWKRCLK